MTLLTQDHLTKLHEERSIALEIIQQRGYQSLPQPEDLIDRRFSKAQAKLAPALGIPLWNVHGQRDGWQIRPDHPRQFKDGRLGKYELPKGDHLILDVHPRVQPLLGDPAVPLWLTEGALKGDSLASRGVCAIALNGVWGFKGTNEHKGKVILPDWGHVALNGRTVYVVFDSDLYHKKDVDRALKALYAFLRSKAAIPRLVQWPEDYRQTKIGVDDFLARGGTLEDLLAMVPPMGPLPQTPAHRNGHVPPPPQTPDRPTAVMTGEDYPYSDAYNALCLVRSHGHEMRYCSAWKAWLTWTGTHWERDTTGLVLRWQRQTVQALGAQLPNLGETESNALLTHIKTSLNTSRLKAAVEQAHSWAGISLDPTDLDADPWVLNCTNGTLNLRTGELRDHSQADLITKCLITPYDPQAQCPTWQRFLWRIMGGTQGPDDPDMSVGELEQRRLADERATALIAYLQRTTGYTLTGSTREQCLFLCHGPTKTGKSTYLAMLRHLLGPYGKQTDMQTFLHKDRPEVRNDLADLAGTRYVYAVESQEGKRLAEGLVKQMTGGVDAMKARFLYEELFEFRPQFKAYIGTNHAPQIKDSDDAIWERIRRIPFTVQIPKDDRNKDLEEHLLKELRGILAWAVAGCRAWQDAKDLKEPQPVVDSTQAYRAEMDVIAPFLEECCVTGDPATVKIKASMLATAYQAWCKRTNETPLQNNAFIKNLMDKGYRRAPGHANQYYWHGLGLISTDDERHVKD